MDSLRAKLFKKTQAGSWSPLAKYRAPFCYSKKSFALFTKKPYHPGKTLHRRIGWEPTGSVPEKGTISKTSGRIFGRIWKQKGPDQESSEALEAIRQSSAARTEPPAQHRPQLSDYDENGTSA